MVEVTMQKIIKMGQHWTKLQ